MADPRDLHEIVAELRRLHEAATKGEWLVHGPSADPSAASPMIWQHHYEIRVDNGDPDGWPLRIAVTPHHAAQSAHDYALIAAMRNALPRLLNEVERAAKMEAAMRDVASNIDRQTPNPAVYGCYIYLSQSDVADIRRALGGTDGTT